MAHFFLLAVNVKASEEKIVGKKKWKMEQGVKKRIEIY